MIPLIDVLEQSFSTMEELRDAIASQDRRVYEAPLRDVSLSEDGVLHAGSFAGHLTRSALCGLVNTEGAPPAFVVDHCPDDLLVTIVGRLALERNVSVLVQTVNGVATGIMPSDRRPIRYEVLVDRLGVDRPIEEATLSADCLRLTATVDKPRELLPNDSFSSGWELTTSENGWRSTRVMRRVVRLVCANGLMGFETAAVFERGYNSREPVLTSLQELAYALQNAVQRAQLGPAVRWAAGTPIGEEHALVFDYLSRRLAGDVTKLDLADVQADSSWYQLMNALTSAARLHSLELRRRYEIAGGMLMHWFLQRGRTRPPWRRLACEGCEAWDGHPGEQNTTPSVESAQLSLLD